MKMLTHKSPGRPLRRKIHRQDGIWTYRVTSGAVIVKSPDRLTTFECDLDEFTGMTWDGLERAFWKRSMIYTPWGRAWGVTPSMVKGWIDEQLAEGGE